MTPRPRHWFSGQGWTDNNSNGQGLGLGVTLEWARTLGGEGYEDMHPVLRTWHHPWPEDSG